MAKIRIGFGVRRTFWPGAKLPRIVFTLATTRVEIVRCGKYVCASFSWHEAHAASPAYALLSAAAL
jgi:hypothetical protein